MNDGSQRVFLEDRSIGSIIDAPPAIPTRCFCLAFTTWLLGRLHPRILSMAPQGWTAPSTATSTRPSAWWTCPNAPACTPGKRYPPAENHPLGILRLGQCFRLSLGSC